MKLLGKEIKAVIFDMDGTLVDSIGVWTQIDIDFFAKRGMEVPPDYEKEIVHLGLKAGALMTKERYNLPETPEEIIEEWRQASIEKYSYNIGLKEGAKEVLDYLKDNNVKLSIATANNQELYEPCLKRLGIYDYFEVIKDVNSTEKGKSSPEIFEEVCKQMGVEKEYVLVVEDSVTPLKTAFEAGFLVVAVYDKYSHPYDEEKKQYSHKFVNSLLELIEK